MIIFEGCYEYRDLQSILQKLEYMFSRFNLAGSFLLGQGEEMAPRTISLTADYLVVGAGAMGLAFADEIISTGSDKSTTVVLVDTRASVGGHWNDAYDFVKLHQPAAYYGVNSEVLGSGYGGVKNIKVAIFKKPKKILNHVTALISEQFSEL